MRTALLILLIASAICAGSAASLSLADDAASKGSTIPDEMDELASQETARVRQKRNPLIARGVMAGAKLLGKWYSRRNAGKVTSTGLKVVNNNGGLRQAVRDYNSFRRQLDITGGKRFRNGRVSFGRDGSRMIVRGHSKDGRPTLEFQNPKGKSVLKIRYD